ncbi:hypothetical protein VRK_22370 [Vibrio sp. MEBiC08052]|nr:hypothetical protein VRK_22370 [Vibrio sp. MEBiC08052]
MKRYFPPIDTHSAALSSLFYGSTSMPESNVSEMRQAFLCLTISVKKQLRIFSDHIGLCAYIHGM